MKNKEIMIGNCTYENPITVKQVLLKIKNFEINISTLNELLADEDCFKQYADDTLRLCLSCGIFPDINPTPGDEQYCINMFGLFCEETPLNKMLFRQFAEDVDYGQKEFFSKYIDDGSKTVLKYQEEYTIIRLSYRSYEDLRSDIEKVAMNIVALSEPELGLLTLINPKIGNWECNCENEKVDFKAPKMSRKYPFIIHGSIMRIEEAFPTHTHGLNKKGWPEFMVDPLCYGSEGNAVLINSVYDHFKKPRRKKLLSKVLKGKTIEVPVNKLMKYKEWKALKYPICFRQGFQHFRSSKDGLW
jgi:hypothetical protein